MMKHITNIVKFIVMFTFQLLVTIVGWFLIPLFMIRQEEFECTNENSRPNRRFKDKWFDSIFGNSEDGNNGDIYYKEKYDSLNWWTTYNWCAFRNPIHNLALAMGVDEVITSYLWQGYRYTKDTVGHEGFVYSKATGESGKVYPMYSFYKCSF